MKQWVCPGCNATARFFKLMYDNRKEKKTAGRWYVILRCLYCGGQVRADKNGMTLLERGAGHVTKKVDGGGATVGIGGAV